MRETFQHSKTHVSQRPGSSKLGSSKLDSSKLGSLPLSFGQSGITTGSRSNYSGRKFRLAILAITSVMIMPGCVRRRMTVRTNPPGATVSVDNQVIGTTPAATSFVYYGTRELRIEKDGYRTETLLRKINPPWYQLPGLDFVSESLWPGEIRDERVIDIQLVPKELEKTDDVIDRADALRSQSISGMVTAPR
jgi:hypothetical protein